MEKLIFKIEATVSENRVRGEVVYTGDSCYPYVEALAIAAYQNADIFALVALSFYKVCQMTTGDPQRMAKDIFDQYEQQKTKFYSQSNPKP